MVNNLTMPVGEMMSNRLILSCPTAHNYLVQSTGMTVNLSKAMTVDRGRG